MPCIVDTVIKKMENYRIAKYMTYLRGANVN